MSELKSCQLCGSDSVLTLGYGVNFEAMCQCRKCGCKADDLAWNNRQYENKLKACAVREAVNFLERPDVPLAPSLILSDDLNEYADKLERGEL